MNSLDTSVSTADSQDGVSEKSISTKKVSRSNRRAIWGGRTFRFSLKSFRLDGGLSLRRFSIVEAAFLLMLALLASRGLGVIRQSIFNALFGTGPDANAYYAASRLPDTLFNLIAGGALSHAFIPVFLSYENDKGSVEAWKLTSLVFNVILVLTTLIIIIGEFITPAFVNGILVPGYSPSEQALTAELTRIMLLQPLILGLGTIVTAVLNSKRQFLLPALALAAYNIGLIAGLLVTLAIPGVGIYGPTYGVLAAAALLVGIQVPALVKQGVHYSFIWNLKHPGLHEVMRLLGPNALSLGIAYIGLIVDTNFASYLPDQASLSALHNAQMLQALPIALISQAIGQALLPHLAVHAKSGRYVRMRQTAIKVMGGSILLTVPAGIVLALLGKPMIHILFEHGAFDAHSSALTNVALIGYAIGLPGVAAGSLLVSGFYALKDALTPLLSNIFALVARYGLIVFFLGTMKGPLVIIAIPLALAGSATAEAVFLCLVLLFQLSKGVKADKGMVRLLHRRSLKERPEAASRAE